jgi:SAM-dependent methyltransferase
MFRFFLSPRDRPKISRVERYVLRGGEWGYQRLQLLARVLRADTVELLCRVGLRPGMRCLDLGCGGGEGTFELAQLAAPGGLVVGITNAGPATADEVAAAL